jgi:hypothetical protein
MSSVAQRPIVPLRYDRSHHRRFCEARSVQSLVRMMRLAAGGARGLNEARRMLTEKAAALVEAQATAAATVMTGHKSHAVAQKIVGVVTKRVRANKQRLSRR